MLSPEGLGLCYSVPLYCENFTKLYILTSEEWINIGWAENTESFCKQQRKIQRNQA